MRINIISSTKDVEKSALTFPIGTLQYNLIKFYRTEMQIQREWEQLKKNNFIRHLKVLN